MGKRIVFMGAGGVGGYVGGHIARSGEDVTLVGQWPEHIEAIKRNGIHLTGTKGEEHTVQIQALHLHEVQSLFKQPVDVAFICTKSYDTEWATMMIKQYLAHDGFVVSLQNSINEDRIAGVVGWGKVVGCVARGIGVTVYKPGHVRRTLQPGGTIFRVGEVHGRITSRVQDIARMLSVIDATAVTTNIWGERWTKLTMNSMSNGIKACTGLDDEEMNKWPISRHLSIRLCDEAIKVGRALGYDVGSIFDIAPETWMAAAAKDPSALGAAEAAMLTSPRHITAEGRSSTVQDMLKGRRTEVDFFNGLVAANAQKIGVPAPTHAALAAVVRRVERGELEMHRRNVESL